MQFSCAPGVVTVFSVDQPIAVGSHGQAMQGSVRESLFQYKSVGLMLIVALGVAHGAAAGCSDSSVSEAAAGGGGTTAEPPLLGPEHPGYKAQHCEQCHTLPVDGHTAILPSECAACHGGNGACNPNGPASARVHDPADDCSSSSCHGDTHSFTEIDCASCHFAAAGVDDCPEGVGGGGTGLLPASELASDCFGWPAKEFSPTNKANLLTGITEGAQAIDFVLNDHLGESHSLGMLLQTRPVVLVFGAYT